MLTFHLKDAGVLDRAEQAITRGEPFKVVIEGFRSKMIRKLMPIYKHLLNQEKRKLRKFEVHKYWFYALFSGEFSGIFYSACKARMEASWEEREHSLIVTFMPKNLEQKQNSPAGDSGSSLASFN